MRKFLKENIGIIGAAFFPVLVLLIIYAIKGVYPFGSETIAYYDMAQAEVPGAYIVYDFLHGTNRINWNWLFGGGISCYGSYGSLFSPATLVLLFVSRDMILPSMSLILLLKVSCCSMAMAFFVKQKFGSSEYWQIICGMLYASCGFVIQYYTNITFLDSVALFPLLMYFTDELLEKKKYLGYVICLTIGIVNYINLTSMACFYIVIYALYTICRMEKEERRKAGSLLGIATLLAMCLSAVLALPNIISLFGSTRAALNVEDPSGQIFTIFLNSGYFEKRFMLYGCEMAMAIFLLYLIEKRVVWKQAWKYLRMVILLMIPIYLEPSNVNWHIGGYVQFPMRFGYMLVFSALALMMQLHSSEREGKKVPDIISKFAELLCISFVPILAFMSYEFAKDFLVIGIFEHTGFAMYRYLLVATVLTYLMAFLAKDKKVQYGVCTAVVVVQCVLGWYGFVAPQEEVKPECAETYVINGEKLHEYFFQKGDKYNNYLCRVKDSTTMMNANYGIIMERASMSSWSYSANAALVSMMQRLGYNENHLRTLDASGTIFSDALFHMTDLITYEKEDERLYQFCSEVGEFCLSTAKYCYPFGVVVNNKVLDEADAKSTVFGYQNALFELLDGNHGLELIQVQKLNDYCTYVNEDVAGKMYQKTYYLPVDKEKVVYIDIPTAEEYAYTFLVNGEAFVNPDISDKNNLVYPAFFANGLINLGIFDDEMIEFSIKSEKPIEDDDYSYGLLDLKMLADSIAKQETVKRDMIVDENRLKITLDNSEGAEYLLLPVASASGTVVAVNGLRQRDNLALDDALVLVELVPGENVIEIKNTPKALYAGMVISVIALICLVVLPKMLSWLFDLKVFTTIILIAYYAVAAGLLIYIYIIPIITAVRYSIIYFIRFH